MEDEIFALMVKVTGDQPYSQELTNQIVSIIDKYEDAISANVQAKYHD